MAILPIEKKVDVKSQYFYRNLKGLGDNFTVFKFKFTLNHELQKMDDNQSCDGYIKRFIETFVDILDQYCPLKKVHFKKLSNPWITNQN